MEVASFITYKKLNENNVHAFKIALDFISAPEQPVSHHIDAEIRRLCAQFGAEVDISKSRRLMLNLNEMLDGDEGKTLVDVYKYVSGINAIEDLAEN